MIKKIFQIIEVKERSYWRDQAKEKDIEIAHLKRLVETLEFQKSDLIKYLESLRDMLNQ